MDPREGALNAPDGPEAQGEIVPLPAATRPADPVPPPAPLGRMHGLAIGGMAFCALAGIVSLLAFISVQWPERLARYPMIAFVSAGIGFIACASIAVFSAARDTYTRKPAEDAERKS